MNSALQSQSLNLPVAQSVAEDARGVGVALRPERETTNSAAEFSRIFDAHEAVSRLCELRSAALSEAVREPIKNQLKHSFSSNISALLVSSLASPMSAPAAPFAQAVAAARDPAAPQVPASAAPRAGASRPLDGMRSLSLLTDEATLQTLPGGGTMPLGGKDLPAQSPIPGPATESNTQPDQRLTSVPSRSALHEGVPGSNGSAAQVIKPHLDARTSPAHASVSTGRDETPVYSGQKLRSEHFNAVDQAIRRPYGHTESLSGRPARDSIQSKMPATAESVERQSSAADRSPDSRADTLLRQLQPALQQTKSFGFDSTAGGPDTLTSGRSVAAAPDAVIRELTQQNEPRRRETSVTPTAPAVAGYSVNSVSATAASNTAAATGFSTATEPANIAQQIAPRLISMNIEGQQFAKLQLQPAELGALEIRVAMTDDGAVVSINTQQQGTRELIEAGLPRLREMFEESGTQLLDVDVSDAGSERQSSESAAEDTAVVPSRKLEINDVAHVAMQPKPASSRLIDLFV